MKRPAFQFYPADWLTDSALQSCSLAARGLWIQMICIMHKNEPYGHLVVNGKPIKTEQLARLVGEQYEIVEALLAELEEMGVFARDDQNCIFSRRMVSDEQIRNKRAEGGKLGGNPQLLKQKKGSHKVKPERGATPHQEKNANDNFNIEPKVNSKVNLHDNLPSKTKVNPAANFCLTPSSSSSSPPSISSSTGGSSSSSSKTTDVKIFSDAGKIVVLPTDKDDDAPLQAEEWAEFFAKQDGKRAKVHPFFTDWCAARVTIEQVQQAIRAAQEKATESIACLPAYVNRILASGTRKRRAPLPTFDPQEALEAHNAQVANQWLAAVEVNHATAG